MVLDTNKVWLGAMMNGLRCNYSEFSNILAKSYELGIKQIDTSPSYIGGEADNIISKSIRKSKNKEFIINTKIGRAYKRGLDKKKAYLDKNDIKECLSIIYKKFDQINIGSIQLHINCEKKIMEEAIICLINEISKKQIQRIGFCNINDSRILELISNKSISLNEVSCQRRFCLGIINSSMTLPIKYIAYGLLNAGSILNELKGSRILQAKDSEEILKRDLFIKSAHKYKVINENCKKYDVSIKDFALALPQLLNYENYIIGPTKLVHLNAIEKLQNKEYWERILLVKKEIDSNSLQSQKWQNIK